ncbi:MAG: LytTR family DNA-binding domain-containing protein [Bacteroidota bacterium]|nr:LytTR family DNA-binding domain-containing protein [Bacteroidota bacterium]
MAIRALIVDDELNNRENLHFLLREYCKDVEVIGLADSVDAAFKIIKSEEPDLVFLDIKMPEKDGFKLLESLNDITFEVIIVTAYNQYAIQAIKFCAIDYLLKPIDTVELSNAVDNVALRISEKQENQRLRQLISHMHEKDAPLKIGLASQNKVDFVEISRITRCEADNNYTHVFLDKNEKMTISKTLKEFEELLKDHGFIRLHQSHLINSAHIQSYQKSDGGYIQMTDGSIVPISRARKNEIIALIRKYSSI